MTADAKAVAEVLDIAVAAAAQLPMIRAVALVGSRAAGRARPDSDLDLVFLVTETKSFSDGDGWRQLVPTGGQFIRSAQWGVVTERRVRLASGLEVELNFAAVSWAWTQPLDAGTHRVVLDGMLPLYDPDRLLVALADAVTLEAVTLEAVTLEAVTLEAVTLEAVTRAQRGPRPPGEPSGE